MRPLQTESDLLRRILGPARYSHPEEYAAIMQRLEGAGVEIDFRPGSLACSPRPGGPGRLVFDPDGSIGALRHEYRHFLDVRDAGYPALSHYYRNLEEFWHLEFRAYMEEIRLARKLRQFDIAREIIRQMRARRKEILNR